MSSVNMKPAIVTLLIVNELLLSLTNAAAPGHIHFGPMPSSAIQKAYLIDITLITKANINK